MTHFLSILYTNSTIHGGKSSFLVCRYRLAQVAFRKPV